MFKKAFVFIIAAMLCGAAFAVEATVVSVTGKVEMQDGISWLALHQGDKIEKGTVISTGYKSGAVLEFKGSQFTLGALTRMTLEDLIEESDKDTTKIFIDSGKISANVNSADGKRVGFKVRSPIATASVRGTIFEFSAPGELSVDRGLVSFSPTDSSNSENDADNAGVPVAANQQSKVNDTNGVCSSPAQEKAQAATGAASATVTLSQEEAISTAAAGTETTTTAAATFEVNSATSTKTATLNVTIVGF